MPKALTAAPSKAARDSILDLSKAEIEALVVELGEPPFRAKQLWAALYRALSPSFADMTTLARSLRGKLGTTSGRGSDTPIAAERRGK